MRSFLFSMILLCFVSPLSVQAQDEDMSMFEEIDSAPMADIVQCGTPAETTAEPTDSERASFEYCDIYERAHAYKDRSAEFTRSIEDRARDFEAPRQRAWKDNEERLQE